LHCGANSLITGGVEYILRVLQAKKITFNSYDLASDEDAKRLWRRKAPVGELRVFAQRDYSSELTPCARQAAITWHTDWWDLSRGGRHDTLAMNAHANISLVLYRLVSIPRVDRRE